jgi:Zn-dependent metalloprotease
MTLVQRLLLGVGAAVGSILGLVGLGSSPPPPSPPATPAAQEAAAARTEVTSQLERLTREFGVNLHYSVSARSGYLRFLSGLPADQTPSPPGDPEQSARDFLSKYGSLFGVGDQASDLRLAAVRDEDLEAGGQSLQFRSFDPFRRLRVNLGMKHVRFQQTYQGVPVFGAELIVHLKRNGQVFAVNGALIPRISLDVTPMVSRREASRLAGEIWKQAYPDLEAALSEPALVIFNPGLVDGGPDEDVLTWRVEVKNAGRPLMERWFYFIDARTGDLVFKLRGIFTARDRETFDCGGSGAGQCGYPNNPTRSETDEAVGVEDVDNAHDFAGQTYDYYAGTHDRDGPDDKGGTIVTFVRIPGSCPNAYFDGFSLNFCPRMPTRDVVAHEYTHWVTSETAGLSYRRQSGALNESFSDVFGAAVDNDDWQMGEGSALGVIRNMADPPSKGDPDRLFSPRYHCGSSDNGGVHTNSGVQNKAAYLIAEGGSFNGCAIQGIGREKEEKIFYRALVFYLTSSANFRDDYDALLQACADLYGADSSECAETAKALQAVEMDQQPAGEQSGARCLGRTEERPNCAGETSSSSNSSSSSTSSSNSSSSSSSSSASSSSSSSSATSSSSSSSSSSLPPASRYIYLETPAGEILSPGSMVHLNSTARICYRLESAQNTRIVVESDDWTYTVVNPWGRGGCYKGAFDSPIGEHRYILKDDSDVEIGRTSVRVAVSFLQK